MAKPLVIVESPAKAKTIAGFLGSDYVVESSIGHIRDLPRSAAEVPAAYKGSAWARLGVNVDEDFKPLYVVSTEKKPHVRMLKSLLDEASELYLATDEDREGESIAWHLREVLSPRVPVRRMVFHEITAGAIREAIAHPRDIDERLVDAQEARRILDRLYGYEVSPVLWKKVGPKLSAGRVQSVATRMVVERERDRMRFRSASWWSVQGRYAKLRPVPAATEESFEATLVTLGGRRIATGRDFDDLGRLKDQAVLLLGDEAAHGLAAALTDVEMRVASVEQKPFRRSPAAPFLTSTLQQEAARKLRFTAQRTMSVAQRLYEQGYITYMRTDSTTLSETALKAARHEVRQRFGDDYLPASPRRYERKVKNAQEAHEAIRPAGESFRSPAEVAGELHGDERRLYELVWQRTIASQMKDAEGVSAQVRLEGETSLPTPVAERGTLAEMSASGRVITFPGFLQVYVEGGDDEPDGSDDEVRLPPLERGEVVDPREVTVEDHATKPPARYTEASLVKALEEQGIGRPSTYANIIGTIQDRGYVWKKGSALVPTFTAFAVVGLLERHFSTLVDYGFTASMENDLDEIAAGEEEAVPWLRRFYFGEGSGPLDSGRGLKDSVSIHLDEIDAREVNSIPLGQDSEGREVVVRVGRYGPYLSRGEERASLPDETLPDELTIERAGELLEAPTGDRLLGTDPVEGKSVQVRVGRYGPYAQLGDDGDGDAKPRRSSLFKTMDPTTITLEQAIQLLSLPRVLGHDAAGAEVVALNGPYGPYVRLGKESRSLETEDRLFTVTLEEALALLAQPKQRSFGRASASPLRELGNDPDSGGAVLLRQGRFGPYVTDGTINASLRRGDSAESITPERAFELLAERRAAGPSKTAGRRGRGAKKASATKKAAAKKTPAKKTPAKKAAAKKAPAKKSTAKKAAARKAPAKKAPPSKKATGASREA
jgi:DNA topoisomerase I